MENNILSVKDLTVHYVTSDAGVCRAVNHISFDLKKGETLLGRRDGGRKNNCSAEYFEPPAVASWKDNQWEHRI